jgi:hypothetical protein
MPILDQIISRKDAETQRETRRPFFFVFLCVSASLREMISTSFRRDHVAERRFENDPRDARQQHFGPD